MRHYLARLGRRSRCFSRSIDALRRAVKLFVHAWNRRQLHKRAFPRYDCPVSNVRTLVHAADPDVTETIKRTNRPYFVVQGNICALLATKDHVNVFLYDPLVPDPAGLITAGHENKTERTTASVWIKDIWAHHYEDDCISTHGRCVVDAIKEDAAPTLDGRLHMKNRPTAYCVHESSEL